MRDEGTPPVLIAYRTRRFPAMPIIPAGRGRDWMDALPDRYAYRCLPLAMANEAGWWILNSHDLAVTWTGGNEASAVQFEYGSAQPPYPAVSHFGYGILTWRMPYLFRSPTGCDLLLRGIANWPKDGIAPLEGLVETAWAVTTATMNWQMTRPGHTVHFAAAEPVCTIVPQWPAHLEAFTAEVRDIADDPGLERAYRLWVDDRNAFNRDLATAGSAAARERWQKHYMRGLTPQGQEAPAHRTRLRLQPFDDPSGISPPTAE